MTLKEFLDLVASGYPDEYARSCYDGEGEYVEGISGDTLAEFVILEAMDAYKEDTDEERKICLVSMLKRTVAELEEVIFVVEESLDDVSPVIATETEGV